MHLNIQVMCQPEFYMNGSKSFDQSGKLIDEKTKEILGKYWKAVVEFV
jgi:hypothetical protein